MAWTHETMKRLSVPDDFSLSTELIKRTGVATLPGYSFYRYSEDGRPQVTRQTRFCFAKSEETLLKVAERLRSELER